MSSDRNSKPKDIPEEDVRFIVWQLNNLIETTKNGFDDIKKVYIDLDRRVNSLELWQAASDAADKLRDAAGQTKQGKDSSSTDHLIKIIFIILGLLGTALGLVGSGIIRAG